MFLLSRNIKAYPCPNIINFDGVDFSERSSEKLKKFLLTLSIVGLAWYFLETDPNPIAMIV